MSIEEIEVQIIDDSLTPLVESTARPRGADHGATALRELTREQLAIFLQELTQASLVSAQGVMVDYMAESIASNTKPKWRLLGMQRQYCQIALDRRMGRAKRT
ncbi:hypothetical protein ACA910_014654 [Epithemia clementina (nom. ined.)]